MARGYPTFYPNVGRTIEGEFLPELAVPPVWLEDDFDTPAHKWIEGLGTRSVVTNKALGINEFYPHSGEAMLFITSEVGGEGNVIRRLGTIPLDTNFGIQIMFAFGPNDAFETTTDYVIPIHLYFDTDASLYKLAIKYIRSTGKWYYLGSDGTTYYEIGTRTIYPNSWHYVKVIVNPSTGKYISLQVDNHIYDLTAYSYQKTTSGGNVYFYAKIIVYALAGETTYLLCDNYKITYNES